MRTANAVGDGAATRKGAVGLDPPEDAPAPQQYVCSSVIGLLYPELPETCVVCDVVPAVRHGFCAACLASIEGDIWMEDIAPRRAMTGRIIYGTTLPDRFP